MKPTLTRFGVVFTIVYILGLLYLRWHDLHTLGTIPINELGDFLAGAFGPLMLLWLVLGFLQQQAELKQNTEALLLQAEELKNSVEQHRQLVEATREQVAAEQKALEITQIQAIRESQPRFLIVRSGFRSKAGQTIKYEIEFQNTGESATEIQLKFEPALPANSGFNRCPFMARGESKIIEWTCNQHTPPIERLEMEIICLDRDSRQFSQRFDLEHTEDQMYLLSRTKTG